MARGVQKLFFLAFQLMIVASASVVYISQVREDVITIDPGFSPHKLEVSNKELIQRETQNSYALYEDSFEYSQKKYECPFNFGDFPDFDDCKYYYSCMGLRSTRKKCKGNLYFDKIDKNCTQKASARCATKDDIPKKITFECPYTFGSHTYSEDCSMHYLCLFGKASLMTCNSGKLFDDKKRKCRKANEVDCGRRPNPYKTTTTYVTTKKPTKRTTKRRKSTPQMITSRQTKIFISDSTGTDRENMSTSPGTTSSVAEKLSSPFLNITDNENTSTDTINITEISTPSSTNTDRLEISATEIDEVITNFSISTEEFESSTSGTSPYVEFVCLTKKGKFPHEIYCNLYFQCRNSKAHLEQCPEGTFFSTIYNFCYSEESVDCGERKREDSGTITTHNPNSQQTMDDNNTSYPPVEVTSENLPSSESNNKSEYHSTGTVIEQTYIPTTNLDGVSFPESSTSIQIPKSESTEQTEHQDITTETTTFQCPSIKGKYPHEKDCYQYYVCKRGLPYLEQCPEGTLFRTDYSLCYTEEQVDCGNRKRKETEQTDDDIPTTQVNTEDVTEIPIEEDVNSDSSIVPTGITGELMESSSPESGPAFACPTRRDRHRHETHCALYYDCGNGQAVLRLCPIGTMFETNYRLCRTDNEVDCGNRLELDPIANFIAYFGMY